MRNNFTFCDYAIDIRLVGMIVIFLLFIGSLAAQKDRQIHYDCIDPPTEIKRFSPHPEFLQYDKDGNGPLNASSLQPWSIDSPYGGTCITGNTCDNTSIYDCCFETPCQDYKIPVVLTFLLDNSCGNHTLTLADVTEFYIDINNEFDCLGIPFEFIKCNFWDDSGVNYQGLANGLFMGDMAIRTICDSDLNLFYRNGVGTEDGPPNDPNGDNIDDADEFPDFNIPNVLNIYIPGNYNGFTNPASTGWEGGVSYFADSDINTFGLAIGINGFKNTNGQCNGISIVPHELGHWFGLYHTHGKTDAGNGPTDNECPNGSNCCTQGDNICDTEADPGLNNPCVTPQFGCVWNVNPCPPPSGCGSVYSGVSTIGRNIMSYSNNGCQDEFTPCQIAKMVDGLLCARSTLSCCDPNFADTDDATPYVTQQTIEICIGDPVPTFVISMPNGGPSPDLKTNCIGWYYSASNTTDFNELGTGLAFTPLVSTTAVGTFDFYFDDDLNNYSTIPCDDDKRKKVTLIIKVCATCPINLTTSTAPPIVVSSQSTCPAGQTTPSGGVIAAPATACPTGSTIQYSTNGGTSWTTTLPSYDQMNAITVLTRCNCDADNLVSSMTASVTTMPGTCANCPTNLATSTAPPIVVSSQSTCPAGQTTPSGGVIAAPATACPTGSTIQYSTNGGTSWTTTLPSYDQMNAITVLTRCNCDADNLVSSMTASVTTMPGTCANCPTNLATSTAPPIVVSSQSTCPAGQTTPSGGVIAVPATACPTGSSIQYSTNGGTSWTTTLPSYDQMNAITALTRCNCDADMLVSSMTSTVTTMPGTCANCPANLATSTAPAIVVSSQSTCPAGQTTPSGGVIAVPATACPTGSSIQYSTNGGTSWTTTLPSYDQMNAITVLTRCNCDADMLVSSMTSTVTTMPGTCANCPTNLATSTAPPIVVSSQSTCPAGQTTPSGGVIAVPATACPTGSTIQYSTNGGTSWTTTLPSYDQMNAITALTRCNCDADMLVSSMTSTVTTMPGTCANCPANLATSTAPAIVVSSQSTCPAGQTTPSGGVIAVPATACPTGSTIQYSTNGGTSWTTTLPSYDQMNAITVLTRCNCDADMLVSSMTSTVTTMPQTCLNLITQKDDPAVSDPCDCKDSRNVFNPDGSVLYFHDVLTITGAAANAPISISNNQNFLDSSGNPITGVLGNADTMGNFSFPFYHPVDLASTGDLNIGGRIRSLTGSICTACNRNTIPTISQWGIITLSLLMLILGTVAVVNKRKHSALQLKE